MFGIGLVAAAGLNFVFSSLMGRMLPPPVFGTLGVLIAALLALIGPVNALSGGTEMFAALHDRFPRGPRRLLPVGVGLGAWVICQAIPSSTVRASGWFILGGAFLVLLAWNRGALVGLGRFGFVGFTFVLEGIARLVLPVSLVFFGLGLTGAAAGMILGMLVALLATELAVPRLAETTREPLGRDVWLALLGLFALGLTQIVDVFAIRIGNPAASGSYVGAASLARIALFSQMPAAAYALRRAALEGAHKALNRILILALVPGVVAIALIEGAPGLLLRLAYGSRFVQSAGTLRILGAAMLLGGFATVAAQLLMGRRLTAWVGGIVPVSFLGTLAIVTTVNAPISVAIFSLAIQSMALMAVGLPAVALVRADRRRRPEAGGVVILSWRDTTHPQGGGSEVYLEELATRLAAGGRPVTIFCAAYEGAPKLEMREGVRFVRRGSWRTVYAWAFVYHLMGWLGPHDVMIDVQNGIPFFSRLYCHGRVICLVHHVHRNQWAMNFSPRQARLGWWIESRLAPRLLRGGQYVAVSDATKAELVELGVREASIEVVRNGARPMERIGEKSPSPLIASLGRLVPHKRVEILIDAAARLRHEFPGLRVVVMGCGPWDERLREHIQATGVGETVELAGWVDHERKRNVLTSAWVLAVPSVMEGWGQSVIEAAACGTPAVAFRVGGLKESIQHEETGLLAESPEEFELHLRSLLRDDALRIRLGDAAASYASALSWDTTAARFSTLLRAPERGEVLAVDPYLETGLAVADAS